MKYLNREEIKEKLFLGEKIKYQGMIYWANMVTMEIYTHSVEAEMNGVINGWKVADITKEWEIKEIKS